MFKKKYILSLLIVGTFLSAGVVYVTPNILGYKIAHKILKEMPDAKSYEYQNACYYEAKERIKMGLNIRLSAIVVVCMDYIKHPDKKPPNRRKASHYLDQYMD